jgi:hypothetical protein
MGADVSATSDDHGDTSDLALLDTGRPSLLYLGLDLVRTASLVVIAVALVIIA